MKPMHIDYSTALLNILLKICISVNLFLFLIFI